MASAFIALGGNSQIIRSTDGVTWDRVLYDASTGEFLVAMADNLAGTLVTGPALQHAGDRNKIWTSHDYGVTWTATVTLPAGFTNAPSTFDTFALGGNTSEQYGTPVWNVTLSRFAVPFNQVIYDYSAFFSADGDTWTTYATAAAPDIGGQPASTPHDFLWWGPGNVYVASFGSNCSYLGYSPTAGQGAADQFAVSDYVIGQALTGVFNTGWFKTNTTYILAFGTTDTGVSVVWKSTDGQAWTESAALPNFSANNGKDSVWWDETLHLWVLCGSDAGGQGIFTSTDGLVWTARLYDVTFTTYSFNSVRRTGWFLTAVGDHGLFYTSTDGITWTAINAACPGSGFPDYYIRFIHSTGSLFIADIQDNNTGNEYLATTPDGVNWTLQYAFTGTDTAYNVYGPSTGADTLNSYINVCTGAIIPNPDNPPPPTPVVGCVPFSIQSPGEMPNAGAEFTTQRIYITANLGVSGVAQIVTPTLIVDGVETALPSITGTGRQTYEIAKQVKGRFFDGIRIDGCLTGRIEIFRMEADIWLGSPTSD